MKTQFINTQLKSILIAIGIIIFFADVQAQIVSIHPPKLFQPEKDPSEIRVSSSSQKHFREKEDKGGRISKRQSNPLSFADDNENGQDDFAQKDFNSCPRPPKPGAGFEGNPETPFYLPPVGYYASESSIAISNSGKIVSISNGWLNYYNENGIQVFLDSLYHFGNSLLMFM
jgi:hypothetical protein